jgi:hypothetical protein
MWHAVRVSVVCAVTAIVVGSPLASPAALITDALTDAVPHEELTPTASSGCTVGTDEDNPFAVNIELQVTPRICCLDRCRYLPCALLTMHGRSTKATDSQRTDCEGDQG